MDHIDVKNSIRMSPRKIRKQIRKGYTKVINNKLIIKNLPCRIEQKKIPLNKFKKCTKLSTRKTMNKFLTIKKFPLHIEK